MDCVNLEETKKKRKKKKTLKARNRGDMCNLMINGVRKIPHEASRAQKA